ncbi:hypothetical protein ACRS6B_09495 [Nocardia asteroides]
MSTTVDPAKQSAHQLIPLEDRRLAIAEGGVSRTGQHDAVSEALGTGTKKDTVNASLREVLETRRRALAPTRPQDAVAEDAFDLDILEDKRKYRR